MNALVKGNQIRFIYDRGTRKGLSRVLTIENITNSHISGTDMDCGDFRNYDRNFMRNITIVNPVVVTQNFPALEREKVELERLLAISHSYVSMIPIFNSRWNTNYQLQGTKLVEVSVKGVATLTNDLLVIINGKTLKIDKNGSIFIDNKHVYVTKVVESLK